MDQLKENLQSASFKALLGVLPPYNVEDIKQAYWRRVKKLHPDHGGDVEDFRALQEAYEQAKLYVDFHGDKRAWIAKHVLKYKAHEKLLATLKEFKAEATTETVAWMQKSVGDFAELTRSIVAVSLTDSQQGDALIDVLTREHESLRQLTKLTLAGCKLANASVLQLSVFKNLQRLDLSRSRVSNEAMLITDKLPMLVSLKLNGTAVGWWTRRKVQKQLRRNAKHPQFAVLQTKNALS